MPTIIEDYFPFEEIRKPSGDYFDTALQAMNTTGYAEEHIWSIAEGEDEEKDGYRYGVEVYGPSRHYINVLGFVATKETHDGATYYEEHFDMEMRIGEDDDET